MANIPRADSQLGLRRGGRASMSHLRRLLIDSRASVRFCCHSAKRSGVLKILYISSAPKLPGIEILALTSA